MSVCVVLYCVVLLVLVVVVALGKDGRELWER